MTNEELQKSLREVIDETLCELEDLAKSNRHVALEIEIGGPGENLAGQPTNGKLDAKKAEDKEDEEDEEDEEDKKAVKKGVLDEAEKAEKEEDEEDEDEDEEAKKAEKDEDKKDKEDKEDKEKPDFLKKSIEQSESLMKSYIKEQMAPIEAKMDVLLNAVKELSQTPIARKAVVDNLVPLKKSAMDEMEPMSKSEVLDKLFELKKSGRDVLTDDIASAELGGPDVHNRLISKYNLIRN